MSLELDSQILECLNNNCLRRIHGNIEVFYRYQYKPELSGSFIDIPHLLTCSKPEVRDIERYYNVISMVARIQGYSQDPNIHVHFVAYSAEQVTIDYHYDYLPQDRIIITGHINNLYVALNKYVIMVKKQLATIIEQHDRQQANI